MNDTEKVVTALRELNKTLNHCYKQIEHQNKLIAEIGSKLLKQKDEE